MAYTLALWTLAVLVDITAVMYFDSQRSMMILFVLGVYAAWRVVYQLVLYPKYFTPLKHLPMPEGRAWLTGNEKGFFKERKWDVAGRLYRTIPNDGLIRWYTALSHEVLLVTSPQGLSEVMTQRVNDFDQTPVAKLQAERITGKGIQFMNGDEHKMHRKYLAPIFMPGHIKALIPVFWSKAVELVEEIEKGLSPDSRDDVHITSWSVRVALDIIGLAGLGHDYDTLRNPENEHKDLTQLYRLIMSNAPPLKFRFVGLLLDYVDSKIIYYLPEARNMALGTAFEKLRKLASDTVDARQRDLTYKDHKDIISLTVRSGVMTKDAIISHVMTFHAAGHITTALSLDWTMYELGKRPQLQRRLREEIRSQLPGSKLHDVNASDIEALPFLRAVCNETLRLYPALPYTTRTAIRDTSILGTRVPKGTTIAWCADAVNRDEKLWGEDASVWNPERWMGDSAREKTGGATSNFAFLTFAAGPKNCIGQHWARAELACLVAAMIGRFEIELANPDTAGHIDPVTALMSKEGVYAKLRVVPGW
ncbi:cytochrome P450 [Hypoxylon rubiginosum]|uniref:Cytochrome P450 n=1 Tax=Hypoxylon rubiginosum TaxID=110542 RepID=A0ACB9YKE8_9PEZI|nr:cytochrome P450 [Hypoxylon rubiginosum]